MKFVTVDELRTKSDHVLKMLADQNEMVVTKHGKPIAVLSSVNEDNFEVILSAVRRARAMRAVNSLQNESVRKGMDNISSAEILDEIKSVRRCSRM